MPAMTHFKLVISSPRDVSEERDCLCEVIDFLNDDIAKEKGIFLEPLRWETDVYPQFHARGPQSAIDEALSIETCDIIVGIFYSRFGTPAEGSNSGTEHELRVAYSIWKQTKKRPLIMIYFNKQPFFPRTIEEIDQFRQVMEFKSSFAREAFYGEYDGLDDFRRRVTKDLAQIIRDLEKDNPQLSDAVTPPISQPPLAYIPQPTWDRMTFIDGKLYTFCGLQDNVRDADILQDFRMDKQRYINPNPVSSFWADCYRGGAISASVEEETPPHLRVTFENKPHSWPCSITIRPIEEKPITKRGNRFLVFESRVPELIQLDAASLSEVWVSVRVVNGYCQHWSYGPSKEGKGERYLLVEITQEWQAIEIPLNSESCWWLFTSDGNQYYGPRLADFSIVAELVLEFGSKGIDRPGPGRGVVLLRNIHLRA